MSQWKEPSYPWLSVGSQACSPNDATQSLFEASALAILCTTIVWRRDRAAIQLKPDWKSNHLWKWIKPPVWCCICIILCLMRNTRCGQKWCALNAHWQCSLLVLKRSSKTTSSIQSSRYHSWRPGWRLSSGEVSLRRCVTSKKESTLGFLDRTRCLCRSFMLLNWIRSSIAIIVVSPLIVLMRDQVQSFATKRVKAVFVSKDTTKECVSSSNVTLHTAHRVTSILVRGHFKRLALTGGRWSYYSLGLPWRCCDSHGR